MMLRLVCTLFFGLTLLHCTNETETVGSEAYSNDCAANMLCAHLTGRVDGEVIRFSLYEITDERAWPPMSMGFPSWAVLEEILNTQLPLDVRIPNIHNSIQILRADGKLHGRVGLAVASMPQNAMIPKEDDEVGFSATPIDYRFGQPFDFGTIIMKSMSELDAEDGIPLGGLSWEVHELGEPFLNAIYMDVYDLNSDGVLDIVTNNNLYMAMGDVELEEVKDDAMVRAYLMNDEKEVGETIQLATDIPLAMGIKVLEDGGEPLIVLGTGARSNTVDKTPVFSFAQQEGEWKRTQILDQEAKYNSSLVVACDLDLDGDTDLVLAGKNRYSIIGSWLERDGQEWIAHLREHSEWGGDVVMHSSTVFACDDINGDSFPDLVYMPLYTDFTKPEAEQKSGAVVLAINPGTLATSPSNSTWNKVIINPDNYMSADMWIADINGDGRADILSNNYYKKNEVTWYEQPKNIDDPWSEHVIGDGLKIPGDMYIADINGDGFEDIAVTEVLGNRALWFENPGQGQDLKLPWQKRKFFSGIGLPGDFVIVDFDNDGDMDYVGVSMILGKVLYVEQM